MDTQTPQSSTVKVKRAITEAFDHLPALQQQLSGMQALMFAPVMGFVPQMRELAFKHLPEDPDVLDALLDRGAELILTMKSDRPAIAPAAAELAP